MGAASARTKHGGRVPWDGNLESSPEVVQCGVNDALTVMVVPTELRVDP